MNSDQKETKQQCYVWCNMLLYTDVDEIYNNYYFEFNCFSRVVHRILRSLINKNAGHRGRELCEREWGNKS